MNSATEPMRYTVTCDGEEYIHELGEYYRVEDVAHLLRPAAREGGLREADNFNDEFFQLRNALRNWPKLPPAYVLKWLDGKFSEDWPRGKAMQRELGLSVIPPKTECEEGAGMWDRITEGKWRAALAPAQAPSAKGDADRSSLLAGLQMLSDKNSIAPEVVSAIAGRAIDFIERAALSASSFTEEEREALERGANRCMQSANECKRLAEECPTIGMRPKFAEQGALDSKAAATLRNLATKGRL